MRMPIPHFIIKNRFQKRLDLYQNILTEDILTDVCRRITGRAEFTVAFDNTGYNKGRLAILEYQGNTSYISFSETENTGRNSSFQSFPSALVSYHRAGNLNKEIYFYFLPSEGNNETPYFIFMYRLMKTAGTILLNEDQYLENDITPFNSVSDLIAQRDLNRGRNRGNSSTYVTVDEDDTVQIFGKTYGASKYETTLLCLAIYEVNSKVELYEIGEGGLRELPELAREVIVSLGIRVITSDLVIERDQEEFENNDSLRSPTYIYNLLEKLGEKKCSLCDCEVPQIIQGAHIWPVASIKRLRDINQDAKLQSALDGNNGLWLCNNHHKLFDIDYLYINEEGVIKYKSTIPRGYEEYICGLTVKRQIPGNIMTANFLQYLEKRNIRLNENDYSLVR